jgi:cytochrome c
MRAATLTALLFAATLSACGGGEDNAAGGHTAAAPAPAPVTDADKQKILAALPAPYNTADIANGQRKFAVCRSCHTLNAGGSDMTGPNLHGLLGRKAATHGGFKYSDALKASGITWDAATLDPWLENPRTRVPGTKMVFAGVSNPKDRVDLIGYLAAETGTAPAT